MRSSKTKPSGSSRSLFLLPESRVENQLEKSVEKQVARSPQVRPGRRCRTGPLASGTGSTVSGARGPYPYAGGQDRAGKEPAAQGGARRHESSVRRHSRSAIGLPAKADLLRDCDAGERPRVRVWQRTATAALYLCRSRAEQTEHSHAHRELQHALWRNLESIRLVCQLARHEPRQTDERCRRTSTESHGAGDRLPCCRCILRSVARSQATGGRRASRENRSVHHGSQSGKVRQRVSSGVGPADRQGAHGRAAAGTHSGQEQSGSGTGPVEHRHGRTGGLRIPAIRSLGGTHASGSRSRGSRKASTHTPAGLEAHSLRGSRATAERCDSQVSLWPASERVRGLGDGQSYFCRRWWRQQLAGWSRSAVCHFPRWGKTGGAVV